MSIAEYPAVTSLEGILRESMISRLEEKIVSQPTVHYLSLLCIKDGLQNGSLDPGTAMAHLESTDIS
jgi:hypothetical protein